MIRLLLLVLGVVLLEGAFSLSAEASWAIFLIALSVIAK